MLRTPGSGRQENSCGIFGFDQTGSATVLAVTGLLLVLDARTGPLDRSPPRGVALSSFITSTFGEAVGGEQRAWPAHLGEHLLRSQSEDPLDWHAIGEVVNALGDFSSVDDLVIGIETRAEHWNDDPKSFVWKKPTDEIVSKVKRGRSTLASVKSAAYH